MIASSSEVVKGVVISSSLYSVILYTIFLLVSGAITLGNKFKEFELMTQKVEQYKHEIVMMSFLAQSYNEFDHDYFEDTSVVRAFDDYIYSAGVNRELLREEKVADFVMHKVASYFPDIMYRDESFLRYRSFLDDKMILERKVDESHLSPSIFSKDSCEHHGSCSIYAGPEQLRDYLLVSIPYQSVFTNNNVISIVSPVYKNGNIVGEFIVDYNLNYITEEGYWIASKKKGSQKHILIEHRNIPFSHLVLSTSYEADNKTKIVYNYPLFLGVYKTVWIFILIFGMIILIEYYRKISKAHLWQLESAINMMSIDELTGIYNRKLYTDVSFLNEINRSFCTVVALDGNRIKSINDNFGHHVGDAAIKVIAESMSEVFRQSDYLIRNGGDEFIAILPKCDYFKAKELCRKLSKVISEKDLYLEQGKVNVSVSFGLTVKSPSMPLSVALRLADKELYLNKVKVENS